MTATATTSGERAGSLAPGSVVTTEMTGRACRIDRYLGGGSQGDVYEADLDGTAVAVKWYLPGWATGVQHDAVCELIRRGSPGGAFLWPVDIVRAAGRPGFGYVMPLRAPRFRSVADLVRRRVDATFRALATVGMWLAHNFLLLHAQGLCYRDISFGNVFFDPRTGDVLVCDNDNVGVDGATGNPLLGTPRFMAPEIVRGEALPSSTTDLHSLAVLLFYVLVLAHPLEAPDEPTPSTLDLESMRRLYGSQPVFEFGVPAGGDERNSTRHDQGAPMWDLYPAFVRALFHQTFTEGLSDPARRVREGEWRRAMAALRDLVVYCGECAAEVFVEPGDPPEPVTSACWRCGGTVRLPLHLQLDRDLVMLDHDTVLQAHHLDPERRWHFDRPLAAVVQHPDTRQWGLRNDSSDAWQAETSDGTRIVVEPGRTVRLRVGLHIDFGFIHGTVGGAAADRSEGTPP